MNVPGEVVLEMVITNPGASMLRFITITCSSCIKIFYYLDLLVLCNKVPSEILYDPWFAVCSIVSGAAGNLLILKQPELVELNLGVAWQKSCY